MKRIDVIYCLSMICKYFVNIYWQKYTICVHSTKQIVCVPYITLG